MQIKIDRLIYWLAQCFDIVDTFMNKKYVQCRINWYCNGNNLFYGTPDVLTCPWSNLRNPFQGETFRCHWKTDDFCDTSNNLSSHPDPPKPWLQSENIGPNDLTFVAEQVSSLSIILFLYYKIFYVHN